MNILKALDNDDDEKYFLFDFFKDYQIYVGILLLS